MKTDFCITPAGIRALESVRAEESEVCITSEAASQFTEDIDVVDTETCEDAGIE